MQRCLYEMHKYEGAKDLTAKFPQEPDIITLRYIKLESISAGYACSILPHKMDSMRSDWSAPAECRPIRARYKAHLMISINNAIQHILVVFARWRGATATPMYTARIRPMIRYRGGRLTRSQ